MKASQNRVKIAYVLAAILTLASVGYLLGFFGSSYFREGTSEATDATPPREHVLPPDDKTPNHTEPRVAQHRPATPLPDSQLPLADQVPVLMQLADAGDPVASCRLIIGINRCNEELRNERVTKDMIRNLEDKSGRNDELLIGIVARSEEQGERKGNFCKGFEIGNLPKPDQLFGNAMHALNPRQKTILALMRSDGSLRRIHDSPSFTESGMYVIPQFLADNTVDFLNAGYQAFDPLALEGLIMLHSPGNAVFPRGVGVWLPNPKLFLKYAMIMHELYGPQSLGRSVIQLMNAVAESMPASDRELVNQLASAEVSRWTNSGLGSDTRPRYEQPNASNTELLKCDG